MPLLDGSQVSPLPLPSQLSSLSPDTEVWSISQTAEIFTDYESYANRYLFYSLPLFTPNNHPNQIKPPKPMSFFDALTLEQDQLDAQIRSNFPPKLKPRLLATLLDPQAQREPSIDHLVSYLYRLHHNRFDVDEKVIVDLSFNQPPSASSTVYSAKVLSVFPPKPIRDLDKNAYADLIHLQSTLHRQLPLAKALEIDDAKAYLYTIQLMDDDQARLETDDQVDHFGASYMEVEPRKLSRHPDSFSRALLKKFIQSALLPYSPSRPHPRWAIHPHILNQYNIPNPTPVPALSAKAPKPLPNPPKRRTPLPAIPEPPEPKKRKKLRPGPPATVVPVRPPPSYQDYLHHSALLLAHPPRDLPAQVEPWQAPAAPLEQIKPHTQLPTDQQPRKKKKKWREGSSLTVPVSVQPETDLASVLPEPSGDGPRESKKSIKYPIEDLDLDPYSIFDGRYLRRQASEPLSLPRKPQPRNPCLTSAEGSGEAFGRRLKVWTFVNVFGIDEKRGAFEDFDKHINRFLARLVKLVEKQPKLRYPATRLGRFTSTSVLPFFASWPREESRAMTIDEREYWIRKALRSSNLWRRAKAEGRTARDDDWAMGLVEILCQRGGIERLGCLGRLMKYLFSAEGTWVAAEELGEDVDVADGTLDGAVAQAGRAPDDPSETGDLQDVGSEGGVKDVSHEEEEEDEEPLPGDGAETSNEDGRRYGRSLGSAWSGHGARIGKRARRTVRNRLGLLRVHEKALLAEFVCDVALESEVVRGYIEECEERLTEVRKERAEVKKEKRRVLKGLGRCGEGRTKTSDGKGREEDQGATGAVGCTEQSGDTKARPGAVTVSPASSVLSQLSSPPPEPAALGGRTSRGGSRAQSDSGLGRLSLSPGGCPKPACKVPEATAVRLATLAARQIRRPDGAMDARARLEGQLFALGLREVELAERFRQYMGVAKLRPLGRDRFFARYWWLDGVGRGGLGGGAVFVSGPSCEEWGFVVGKCGGSEEEAQKRRAVEEGAQAEERQGVRSGEWGVYETEEQLEGLIGWLNAKGSRESQLKSVLKEWREYIVCGMRSRKHGGEGGSSRGQRTVSSARRMGGGGEGSGSCSSTSGGGGGGTDQPNGQVQVVQGQLGGQQKNGQEDSRVGTIVGVGGCLETQRDEDEEDELTSIEDLTSEESDGSEDEEECDASSQARRSGSESESESGSGSDEDEEIGKEGGAGLCRTKVDCDDDGSDYDVELQEEVLQEEEEAEDNDDEESEF